MTEQIKTNDPQNVEPSAYSAEAFPNIDEEQEPVSGEQLHAKPDSEQTEVTNAEQFSVPDEDRQKILFDPETKIISIVEEILEKQANNEASNSTTDTDATLTPLTAFAETEFNSDVLFTNSGRSFADRLEADNPDEVSTIGSMMKNDIFFNSTKLEATSISHSRDFSSSPIMTHKYSSENFLPQSENSPPVYHRPPMPDIVYNVKSGIYADNDPSKLATAETWLGRDLDGSRIEVSGTNWADCASSAAYLSDLYKDASQTIYWSIPLIPQTGATLEDAAIYGTYLNQWASIAVDLLTNHTAGEPIYIRTGWDFNIAGSPWSAAGRESTYIDAYKNFVDAFRSISSDFVFEWTPYATNTGMNPALAYPGDDYVDIIGMDFYWDTAGGINNPSSAWSYIISYNYGLQWLENFADAHGKQTAYSEWGLNSDRGAAFIESAAIWFTQHDVAYNIYSDTNTGFMGQLSNEQYPHTAQIYKLIFGSDSMVIGSATLTETLYGDDHNNYLNGQSTIWSGKDTLIGYDGDDVYTIHAGNIQHPYEAIIEQANEGIDTVIDWTADYVIPDNVENVITVASGTQTVTGNNLDNLIMDGLVSTGNIVTGGNHNNIFNGKGGADTLIGGNDSDTFIFDDVNFSGIDVVKNYSVAEGDKLVFTQLLDTFDPLQDAIIDFLNITQNGANSVVSVDRDGSGSAYGWQTVVALENTTGLTDEAALHTSGNIVI